MRVLVTGGAGFIGSHIVDAYLAAGHDVAVVDDLSSGSAANVPKRVPWYRVDVRSSELEDIFARERPEIVSHHAAQISAKRSVDEPRFDADINVVGSVTLLEAARKHGVRRVIFASTGGAIYGEIASGRAEEDHPCRPLSPYAVAKLSVEHYLDCFRATHGLQTVVLRYANVYGPRQDPNGEAGVVAIFLRRILAGLPPTIFGNGEQIRDFVYVGDVVRANLAALAVATDAGVPSVYNVATGRGSSVNTLWELLAGITRTPLAPVRALVRPGEVLRSVLDPSRAGKALGWQPAMDLEAGLAETWEWFRAQEGRRR